MIHIGFTGTRLGMTAPQARQVAAILDHIRYTGRGLTEDGDIEEIRGHHGCCEGADLEFGHMCRDRGWLVEGHPGLGDLSDELTSLCIVTHPATGHLARNRNIVSVVRAMIGAPPTALPQARGGTWYTIKHAREVGRPILVVAPDGTIDPGTVAWPCSYPGAK